MKIKQPNECVCSTCIGEYDAPNGEYGGMRCICPCHRADRPPIRPLKTVKTTSMPCPYCKSGLLWSEERGTHCDGCDEFNHEGHDDIKNRKTMEEILNSFHMLVGTVLLFNRESKYFDYSGMVTAALLNFDAENDHIIAITGKNGWFTFHKTTESLKDMFNHCDAFIGKDLESSFLLKAT